MCPGGADNHPEGKNIALDGRLRTVQDSKGSEKPHSIFWYVTRLPQDKAEEANLSLGAASVAYTAEVEYNLKGKKKEAVKVPKLPKIPFFYNTMALDKGIMLQVRWRFGEGRFVVSLSCRPCNVLHTGRYLADLLTWLAVFASLSLPARSVFSCRPAPGHEGCRY